MKATITITDSADASKCTVEIHFDPPLQQTPHKQTPAEQAALICLDAIRQEAEGFKLSSMLRKK